MPPTRRVKDDQNVWNFLLAVFFMAVLIGASVVMYAARDGFLVSVSPLDLIILAFAAFRLTRLVVYDKITRWFRELFVSAKEVTEGGVVYVELVPLKSGIRRAIYELLQCPWCIGIWSSLLVIFVYFVFSWGWFFDFFLALAGMGSLLQIFAALVGWNAEIGRQRAQAAAHSERSC